MVLEVLTLLAALSVPCERPSVARLRFPDNAAAREACDFANAYRCHVRDRQRYALSEREREYWSEVGREAEFCSQCWVCLVLGSDEEVERWRGNDEAWRCWMEKLRLLLGE